MCGLDNSLMKSIVTSKWDVNYNKLKWYMQQNGTIHIEKHEDKELYKWWKVQKKLYKTMFMVTREKELLKDLISYENN